MSACDTCPKPGHCCTRLHLSDGVGSFWIGPRVPKLMALVVSAIKGLSFIPMEDDDNTAVDSGTGERNFAFYCPLLDEHGRCSDYEHRPQLCRDYEPRSDKLCILHSDHKETASCPTP